MALLTFSPHCAFIGLAFKTNHSEATLQILSLKFEPDFVLTVSSPALFKKLQLLGKNT